MITPAAMMANVAAMRNLDNRPCGQRAGRRLPHVGVHTAKAPCRCVHVASTHGRRSRTPPHGRRRPAAPARNCKNSKIIGEQVNAPRAGDPTQPETPENRRNMSLHVEVVAAHRRARQGNGIQLVIAVDARDLFDEGAWHDVLHVKRSDAGAAWFVTTSQGTVVCKSVTCREFMGTFVAGELARCMRVRAPAVRVVMWGETEFAAWTRGPAC